MLETAYSKAIIVFLLIIIVKFYKKMIAQVTKPKNSDDNKQERSILSQILTVPNLLTLSRIFCIPFILYYLLVDKHLYACLLFIYAAISDFLDGYIARKCKNQSSFLGSILDPLADKLLIGSLTITLTLNHMIPLGNFSFI
jgi:cardiolipin synthase